MSEGERTASGDAWYWCLRHGRAERAGGCPAELRLGPYGSEQAARAWKERVEQRNESWEDDDERWHGRED